MLTLQTMYMSTWSTMIVRRSLHTMGPLYSKYYNPKVSSTMAKNSKKYLDKMLLEDVRRKEKEAARMGPKNVPKNPVLYDTNRTQVFNRKFFESVGLVMSQIPDLLGKGITITKVNVKSDFSEVRVFWVAREREGEVAKLLESTSKMIRRSMVETSGLGQLPRIVNVMDTAYLYTTQLDRLFDSLDLGPDIVTEEEDVWEEVEQLELGTDGGGLMRDDIMGRVEMALVKSRAKHRVQYSEEQFQTVYRETMERHGGAHKLEVKSNIKNFLVSRKKAVQRAQVENQTIPVNFVDQK